MNFLEYSCVHTISTAEFLHKVLFIFFFRVIGRLSPVTFSLYSLNRNSLSFWMKKQ